MELRFRTLLSLALALSLAACGPVTDDEAGAPLPAPEDPESADDVVLPGETAEAITILEFLNDGATTFELLDADVGLDVRAAQNLIAHRDGDDLEPGTADDDLFDTMDELDAVPYVGPAAVAKLTEYVTFQGWVFYSTGSWEGVTFTASQVTLALDFANFASLEVLDHDAKLDARAAENILAARPIISMKQLAEVAWVGPAALERVRAFLPTWQEQGVTLEVYDGVTFTHDEAAGALAAANDATFEQLAAAGIGGAQDDLLVEGRPWSSLSLVTSTAGIGPLTTMRLKILSAGYDAPAYVVSSADAVEFADMAAGALRDDEGFGTQLEALLDDVTHDTAWMDSVYESLHAAIATRVATFAQTEIGRSYSSRDAAFFSVYTYGRGLLQAALTAYPEGVLDFVEPMSTGKKVARAKAGILAYWEDVFVHTPSWQFTFEKTWAEVESQVSFDVANMTSHEAYGAYPVENATTFVTVIYGLYTEVTVDDVGKVTNVYVEID